MDGFTETTSRGWFSRLGGAIKGVFFGLVLLVVGCVLLFWNEGRAVRRAKALKEGAASVVSIDAGRMDPATEGKLVHLAGTATTDEILRDPVLGVGGRGIRLERRVEMYQWDEERESKTRKKLGGGTKTVTTYRYHKVWSSSPIDSSDFKRSGEHRNPEFPIQGQIWQAARVTVGAYTLDPIFVSKISRGERLSPGEEAVGKAAERLGRPARLAGDVVYVGRDPGSPVVGDLRISWELTPPSEVSVVGRQVGDRIVQHTTRYGDIALLESGIVPADAMFSSAQRQNRMLAWFLRALGLLMLFIGFSAILKPLSVAGDVVPFVGSLVGFGLGLVSFLLALSLGLVVIAVGWIAYRPVMGIGLLVVAGAGLILLVARGRRQRAAAPSVPPPPPPPPA